MKYTNLEGLFFNLDKLPFYEIHNGRTSTVSGWQNTKIHKHWIYKDEERVAFESSGGLYSILVSDLEKTNDLKKYLIYEYEIY